MNNVQERLNIVVPPASSVSTSPDPNRTDLPRNNADNNARSDALASTAHPIQPRHTREKVWLRDDSGLQQLIANSLKISTYEIFGEKRFGNNTCEKTTGVVSSATPRPLLGRKY